MKERLAMFALGVWLTGTILVSVVAAQNFYTIDRLLAESPNATFMSLFHLKERWDAGTSILKRDSIDAMQRIQTHESSTDGYGLGWRISEDRFGFRHVSHTGGMPGVTTVLSLFPSERVVVVVLTNTRNAAVVRLAQELAALMMPQYGWRLRQAHRSGRE